MVKTKMTEYDGTTSLQIAIEQLQNKKFSTNAFVKLTDKYRERLGIIPRGRITQTEDRLKIYQWERDAMTQVGLLDLSASNVVEPLSTELNIINNDAQLINESDNVELNLTQIDDNNGQLTNELNITQLVNDVVPTVESVVNELNIIHTQSDSKPCDKFISINYRHADNSRHTVQIEQFYIDALIAIGITDISKFVAENAGLKSVTKNVKRSIVNALVNRVAS
jgi:hypothetical protein